MKSFVISAVVILSAGSVFAQETPPRVPTHTVQLTDQQIEGIINAGTACLEKVPMACARYVLYVHDMLTQARLPKPEPKKDP